MDSPSACRPANCAALSDPLPKRRLTADEPGIGGVLKVRPEDFLVDEVALYDPGGEGEHLYLRIEKIGVSHGELVGRLRRHFGVRDYAIGFAGMKDKAAVTRQTVSVHLPGGDVPQGIDLGHDRIRVISATRHTNKVRIGHLAGNSFSIRIREVDPARVTVARRQLARLAATGAPNYYGHQRFGYRVNNHLLGAAVLREDWGGVLGELLGTTGSPFPDYQRQRRELFDQGRYTEAAALWTPADRNELTVVNALAAGRNIRRAARSVGKNALSFWISSFQSSVFNQVLDRRLEAGTLTTLLEGDLAWKHATGSVFRVGAEDLAGGALQPRLEALEISPTGPLWGSGMTRAEPPVDVDEREALEASGITADVVKGMSGRLNGARRPLRVPVFNPMTDAGADEHGPYVRVAFGLPPGAYATILLDELMK